MMRTPRLVTAVSVALLAACGSKANRPPDPSVPGAAAGKVLDAAPAPALASPALANDPALPIERIKLPPGFRIAVYASGLKDARSMAMSPSGTLFVGTRKEGALYAVPNADHDARGDRVITLAKELDTPNGVAFHQGALYVAELSRVLRYDDIEHKLEAVPKPVVVTDRYPDKEHHGWKYLAIGPDDKLYVPVGAPCNVCDEKDPQFASITRLNLDGSGFEIVARGIRNTVGFDWHPTTKQLWFTENGRDRMGDDVPGDELNHVRKPGQHFGFPYCHAGTIADPEFTKQACKELTPPDRVLGPHVAALGMRFYTGSMFPAQYKNQIILAEHGSWNRSKKIGYRLMLVTLQGDTPTAYEVFAEGWLQDEKAWGRPVDVLQTADGALLVSDDEAGAIYRISYEG